MESNQETTQWKPGMPVKGFDPYNIDRVKADLADASCTEFPLEDYKEYLIEKVREKSIRELTIQHTPHYNNASLMYPSAKCGFARVEEIVAFREGCKSFHEDIEKYVSGIAYITYIPNPYTRRKCEEIPLLLINISVGNDTGFDNPIFVRAAYLITRFGEPVFENSDQEW